MPSLSPSSIRRTSRVVRQVESGALSGHGPAEPSLFSGLTLWLAKAQDFGLAGSIGTFTIQVPIGSIGDETDDTEELTAYIRNGCVLEGVRYLLIDACAAGDAALEVLNPTLEIVGVTDGAIAKGASGTISVYSDTAGTIGAETDTGQNITVDYNRYGDVGASKKVRCSWCPWADGGWEIIQAEC